MSHSAGEITESVNRALAETGDPGPDPVLTEIAMQTLRAEDRRWFSVEQLARFSLWKHGKPIRRVEGLTPLLASWNSNSDAAQIRLRSYLAAVQRELEPLPESGLYLSLEVDVGQESRMTRFHDLENYLTPLVRQIGGRRFLFVSGLKRVGGGSQLEVGFAKPTHTLDQGDWYGDSLYCAPGPGCEKREWKQQIYDALRTQLVTVLEPGPCLVKLAWRCSPTRNWVNLWKPTGDAMGPVLGGRSPNVFNPDDDRITEIEFHLTPDPRCGHEVEIGMWWRSLVTPDPN